METKEYRLTDICDFQGGTQPPKEEWITEPREGYVRMLQIRDFTQDKVEHVGYVKDTKRLNKCEEDDILIGRYGASVGKILTGLTGAYNVAIIKTIPNEKLLSKRYLYYVLTGTDFQNFILNIGARAAQAGFNKSDLSLFKLHIPTSLEDQERIADVLGKANNIIDRREKSIALLDEFLRMKFLELFGDPVNNEKSWTVQKLGTAIRIKHGFAFKSEFFSEKGEYVLLTPGNFNENGGYRDRGDKQKFYVGDVPKNYILKKDNILIAMTEQAPGLLGTPILVPKSNIFLHNQRLGLLKYSKEKFDKYFLYFLFCNKKIKEIIHAKATGMKVRHTSPSKIEDLSIYFPPIDLQKEFSKIVEQVLVIREKFELSNVSYSLLFESLSHKALKGKLEFIEKVFLEGIIKVQPKITGKVIVIDKINKKLEEFHKNQPHTGAPAEIDNTIRQLEAELKIKGEIPFWDEYVKYRIVKGKFKEPFTFEQLWEEITKFPFETVPKYDEVATMLFKWLAEENAFIRQQFNESTKQIELVLNETAKA